MPKYVTKTFISSSLAGETRKLVRLSQEIFSGLSYIREKEKGTTLRMGYCEVFTQVDLS